MYPIKFKPLLKERIWGGSFLCEKEVEEYHLRDGIGESWEISGIENSISKVENGKLKGNTLTELLEVYMGDLVGEKTYLKYGNFFPLLLKIIDTSDLLSVQVHPNDELAKERHDSYGKNELWYIIDCHDEAYIYLGFKIGTTQEQYLEALKRKDVESILNKVPVKKGESYYIPAGAVHALGAGILIAEVQQPSDITYRIFDWNRVDKDGKGRELHTELALEAINFKYIFSGSIDVKHKNNESVIIHKSENFTTAIIELNGSMDVDLIERDSFTAYLCVDGVAFITSEDTAVTLDYGEVVFIPNELDNITKSGKGKILEFYIETPEEVC
ncbi:MAG: type I phosphomannose isomerase catalytic subunit [Rikenellaceae bacterium]